MLRHHSCRSCLNVSFTSPLPPPTPSTHTLPSPCSMPTIVPTTLQLPIIVYITSFCTRTGNLPPATTESALRQWMFDDEEGLDQMYLQCSGSKCSIDPDNTRIITVNIPCSGRKQDGSGRSWDTASCKWVRPRLGRCCLPWLCLPTRQPSSLTPGLLQAIRIGADGHGPAVGKPQSPPAIL